MTFTSWLCRDYSITLVQGRDPPLGWINLLYIIEAPGWDKAMQEHYRLNDLGVYRPVMEASS